MILNKFLNSKTNATTRQNYMSDLRQFAVFQWQLSPLTHRPAYDPLNDVTDEQWLSIGADDIRAYLVHAKEQGLSPATVSRRLTAIKNLIDEAAALELYDEAKLSYIKNRIKVEKGQAEHHSLISPEDQNKLLKTAADSPGLKGVRDYLIIRLLLETGVRRFEILNLRCKNILFKAGQPTIFVEVAKNNKSRDIPIGRDTYDFIMDWLSKSGQGVHTDNPLFCPVREKHRGKGDYVALNRDKPLSVRFLDLLIANLVKAAGIESEITAHSFRVTLITDAITGGATLIHAQKIAGHSDPRLVTEIYNRSQNTEPISEYRKHKLHDPRKDPNNETT